MVLVGSGGFFVLGDDSSESWRFRIVCCWVELGLGLMRGLDGVNFGWVWILSLLVVLVGFWWFGVVFGCSCRLPFWV